MASTHVPAPSQNELPDDQQTGVGDREGLWRLLARITNNKVVDLIRRANRKLGDANLHALDSAIGNILVDQHSLTADATLILTDQLNRLIHVLPDDQLQRIAVLKMEGRSTKEIANELDCSLRTVERRLRYIRALWENEMDSEE